MTPKIRIKGFTEEWTEVKLGEKGTFRSSGVDKKIYAGEKIINLLNYLDVYNMRHVDSLNCKQLMHVSASDRQIRECTVEKDDIFFTPTSETAEDIGHVMVISETLPNTCYSYHLMRYRPNHDVFYHTFPNWGFQTSFVRKQMFINAKGVQRMVLGLSEFEDTKVRIPSKSEQKAIANYFTTLENMIAGAEKQIASLSQTKAACLQSMFPQEGKTTPRVRFRGFEGDWEEKSVGNIGITYSGLSGKTKEDFGCGESKYITFLNVLSNAVIDPTILQNVKVSSSEHQNLVRRGDLLFNTSSETPEEVGMCSMMDKNMDNVYLNSFCFGFRVEDINIYPLFISYEMRSHIGRKLMTVLAQGATRYNLSKTNFCNSTILLPRDKEEQQKIAEYFRFLDQQIDLQKKRLEKLRQIKAACLDNMFV